MDFLYHIIVNLALLMALPFVAARAALDPAFRDDLLRRLRGGVAAAPGCIWLHAASVGEVKAAALLAKALTEAQPSRRVVLSVFTRTGYGLATDEKFDAVFRLPPDSAIWMNPLFEKLKPALVILIEAEFWPCMLGNCRRRGIPVLLVNGRMSEKSASRYALFPALFRWLTKPVAIFSMRTETDAERVAGLGIAREKILVTGNVKFDAIGTQEPSETPPIGKAFPRVVFGSTRPGDEKPILGAIARIRQEMPETNFVLAPRHVERCPDVEQLIRDSGLEYIRHSRIIKGIRQDPSLILLDTIGDLNEYYRQCDIAFVGGGFDPAFGGQNILEPAAYGKPVIFGKHMNNFAEEARLLHASGGGIRLDDPAEIHLVLRRLLNDPDEALRRGKLARETVQSNQGAVKRTMEIINRFL